MRFSFESEGCIGTDNLEVMTEARRYNTFIVEMTTSRVKMTDNVIDFGVGIGTFCF